MEENNIENKEENTAESKPNNNQNNSQKQIAGAIIIAGIIIAGAILLKGGGIPAKIDPVKQEAELTKSMPTFSSCLDSGKYAQAIADSKTKGTNAGVSGTPKGFLLRDGKVVATVDGAESAELVIQKIDKALVGNEKTINNINLDPISISDFSIGSTQAKVVLVLYEDFQCPFCGAVSGLMKSDAPLIQSLKQRDPSWNPFMLGVNEYTKKGNVKFVYRDWAFLGPESIKSAEAARCAGDQGKFWEYHDYLYGHQDGENQGNFSSLNLKLFAKEMKLK